MSTVVVTLHQLKYLMWVSWWWHCINLSICCEYSVCDMVSTEVSAVSTLCVTLYQLKCLLWVLCVTLPQHECLLWILCVWHCLNMSVCCESCVCDIAPTWVSAVSTVCVTWPQHECLLWVLWLWVLCLWCCINVHKSVCCAYCDCNVTVWCISSKSITCKVTLMSPSSGRLKLHYAVATLLFAALCFFILHRTISRFAFNLHSLLLIIKYVFLPTC